MPFAEESYLLDGLEVNRLPYLADGIVLTPPKKKWVMVGGARSDGDVPAEEPKYENRVIPFNLRILAATRADLEAKLGAIIDKLQKATANGTTGIDFTWTPKGSALSITFTVLGGEIGDVPINIENGWLTNTPQIPITLTCKPFGRGALLSNIATTSGHDAFQQLQLPTIPGDVSAELTVRVTESESVARRHLEVGVDTGTVQGATQPRITVPFFGGDFGDPPDTRYWTIDVGGSALSFLSGNGELELQPPAGSTAQVYHKETDITDGTVTAKYTGPATSANGEEFGVIVRRTAVNSYLYARIVFNIGVAGGSTLQLWKNTAGTLVQLASTTMTIAASQVGFIRVIMAGNSITLRHYGATTPPPAAASTTVAYTLTGGETTTFATGKIGVLAKNAPGAILVSQFRFAPPTTSTDLLIDADSLQIIGGRADVHAGSYSTGVIGYYGLTTSPVAVCGTPALLHTGIFRVKARVYGSAQDAYVQLSSRVADGPVRTNSPVAIRSDGGWQEVDLGLVYIPVASHGLQKWVGQVEMYTTNATVSGNSGYAAWVDNMLLIPVTHGYGKVRAVQHFDTITSFLVRDSFEQPGNPALTGATPAVGTAYIGTGGNGDWSIDSTGDQAVRTAVSDATPRIVTVGPSMTDTMVQADFKLSLATGTTHIIGLIARFSSTNLYLSSRITMTNGATPSTSAFSCSMYRSHFGADVPLMSSSGISYNFGTDLWPAGSWLSMRLAVDASGQWFLWIWRAGETPSDAPTMRGSDETLTGYTGHTGELDAGTVGIYDKHTPAAALSRYVDNIMATNVVASPVIYPGRTAEIRSDAAERQDSTGQYYAPLSGYSGARLFVPPGSGRRVFVKARQQDVDAASDLSTTDLTGVACDARPRYLVIPR